MEGGKENRGSGQSKKRLNRISVFEVLNILFISFFLSLSLSLKENIDINTLTGIVVDACIKVHTAIGPGCFEKVYEESLYYELFNRTYMYNDKY